MENKTFGGGKRRVGGGGGGGRGRIPTPLVQSNPFGAEESELFACFKSAGFPRAT